MSAESKPYYNLMTWSPEDLVAEIVRLRERVHTVAAEADKRAAGWQRSVQETLAMSEWAERMFERAGLPVWAHQSTLMKHWVVSLARQRDDALASVASRVEEETAELAATLAEVKTIAHGKSAGSFARFVRMRDVLRLTPEEPGKPVTWEHVEAEVLRLREAHDDHLNARTRHELYRKEIREALGLPEGTDWPAIVAAVTAVGAEDPCPYSSCHGGWTIDKNWSPEYPGEWDGTRSPQDGVIPCGFCSHGDWTKPWPPPDGWDGSD